MKQYGYIRVRKGVPSRLMQEEALKNAGCDFIRIDEAPSQNQLDKIIRLMEPGRVISVERLAVFSRKVSEIVDVVARVTERGGKVYSVETDKLYTATLDSADCALDAQNSLGRAQTSKARDKRPAGAGGKPPVFNSSTPDGRRLIRRLERYLEDDPNAKDDFLAEKLGCSPTTVWRYRKKLEEGEL